MTHKTQPTAHAEITAPISADLRRMDGVAQPEALTAAASRLANVADQVRALELEGSESDVYLAEVSKVLRDCAGHIAGLEAQVAMKCLQQSAEPDALAEVSKEQYARMFNAACEALGQISDHLGIDSDIDPGAEPIIEAIDELRAAALQAAPPAPAAVAAPSTRIAEALRAFDTAMEACSDYPDTSGDIDGLVKAVRKARAALAAAPAQAVAVPEGYALVPVEPTDDDFFAVHSAVVDDHDTTAQIVPAFARAVLARWGASCPDLGHGCQIPPLGWNCTRVAGHAGPCAAVKAPWETDIVERGMRRLRDAEAAHIAPPAPAGVAVPDGFGTAEHWKEKAQYWADVAHRLRGEALRGEPVDGIVHPAQEHATQLAGQAQEAKPVVGISADDKTVFACVMRALPNGHFLVEDSVQQPIKQLVESLIAATAAAAPIQAQENVRDAAPAIDAAAKAIAQGMDYPWEHMTKEGRANMHEVAATALAAARAAQGGEPDLDAWKCEKCHGTGIHEFEGYGDSPRGQYPITQREDCDQCETIGWCGPDAEAAARAAKGGAA